MRGPSVVRVDGPLAPHAPGFGARLIELGYAPSSAEDQLRLMAHLSRWLQEQDLDVAALQSAAEIDRFFAERRAGGCHARISSMALAGLLGFLR